MALAFAFATGLGVSADLVGSARLNSPTNQSKMLLIALTSAMTPSTVFLAPSSSMRPSWSILQPCLMKPTAA